MNLEELFAELEMDGPDDLQYFEQLAGLLESDEEIGFDEFFAVISTISAEDMGDLTENYFEDLAGALPDEENELASLVESMKQNLLSLAEGIDDERGRVAFAEELFRFRRWYTDGSLAEVSGRRCSVLEAAATHRAEAFTGEKNTYDFSDALGYDLPMLSMDLGKFSKIDL